MIGPEAIVGALFNIFIREPIECVLGGASQLIKLALSAPGISCIKEIGFK